MANSGNNVYQTQHYGVAHHWSHELTWLSMFKDFVLNLTDYDSQTKF